MKRFMCMLFLLIGLFWGNAMQTYAGEKLERFSEICDTWEEIKSPEEAIIGPGEVQYELCGQEVEEIPITGRREFLSSQLFYEAVEKGDSIPEAAEIDVTDEESRKKFSTVLPLFGTDYSNERWQEDFHFEVTFHSYDADLYRLGALEIPHSEGKPALGGSEQELLAMIGLDDENYIIEVYDWSGAPYTDAAGALCRNAEVSGKRKVWDCAATYQGEAALPDYFRYRLKSTYAPKIPDILSAPATISSIPAPVSQETEPAVLTVWDKLIKWVRTCLKVTIGLGAVIAAILFFRLLRRLAGKMDKERKDRDS